MPCVYDVFFRNPRAEYSDHAADANAAYPVVVDIALWFQQTITWRVHGLPVKRQYDCDFLIRHTESSRFANQASAFEYVKSILCSVSLPLPGGQEKIDALARRIADFIRQSLGGIPTERLISVFMSAMIEMKAELDQEAAFSLYGLKSEVYHGDEEDCSMCMEKFERGKQVRVTPCGHCFHNRCIVRWLDSGATTCPLCRGEVPIALLAEGAIFF